MSMLLFRAGGAEPKAVPLSLVTRLEQLDVSTIEPVDGRELVQYRGQLMPLVRMPGVSEVKTEGRQAILVFSDGTQSMGLVVDEILDIVADRLDIEVANDTPGKIGSAVIKGHATEVVDVGYYIGQAFDDWMDESGTAARGPRRLLLVDDSPFFRDMLVPVLISAGYEVTAVGSAREALELKEKGRRYDVIVSDIEMPEIDGYGFAEALKDDAQWGATPIVALSCHASATDLQQGRSVGFFDFVGKFDREGLVRTLGDSLADLEDAA
jgi:two-component system chemotaxis sensor kinase CheA